MKGIVFYAFAELKRRTAGFLANAIILWVSVFTAISFWHVIDIFSRAADESEVTAVSVIFVTVLLLILTACGYMVMTDRFKRHSREYSALKGCGLTDAGFFAIQGVQYYCPPEVRICCPDPFGENSLSQFLFELI